MKTSPLIYSILGVVLTCVAYIGWMAWQDISATLQDEIQRSTVILIAKPKGGSTKDWIVDSILKGKPSFDSQFSMGSKIKVHSPTEGRQPDAMVVFIGPKLFSGSLEIQAMSDVYDGKVAEGNLPLSELSTLCTK